MWSELCSKSVIYHWLPAAGINYLLSYKSDIGSTLLCRVPHLNRTPKISRRIHRLIVLFQEPTTGIQVRTAVSLHSNINQTRYFFSLREPLPRRVQTKDSMEPMLYVVNILGCGDKQVVSVRAVLVNFNTPGNIWDSILAESTVDISSSDVSQKWAWTWLSSRVFKGSL